MTPQSSGSVNAKPTARILMLIENCAYSTDGRVRCEANSLAAAGYEVTVIGPKRPGERWCETFGAVVAYQYPAPPDVNGVVGYLLEYGYSLAAMSVLSLWVLFRRGFDVVHAHNPPDVLVLLAIFYRLLGKRFVFDQHDLAPDMYLSRFSGQSNRWLHRALLFFERQSCQWANLVIATNESYKQVEVARTGIPESRIAVVRNGPEAWHLQEYPPVRGLRGDARMLIGYVGIMGYQDGVNYLVRALGHLKNDAGRDDWRCVFVGPGVALNELKQLAATLGIADHLEFTGWLDYEQVPQYISTCDLCVVPDPATTYNNRSTIVKVMEYMAQAKPVVAFDLVETRVTAGDAALYASENDERELARKILRLMDDAELRERLGNAGRQRVVETFAWEHQERSLLQAYRRMLSGQAETFRSNSTRPSQSSAVHFERETCAAD